MSNGHQVITEEENGKSYFNLGSADASIVTRKSSSSSSSHWLNGSCPNSSMDIDDNASSSSCESLSSSDDLFNSGEEFDPSDDEEEEEFSSYKQQRSTVLHLSLCKLNKFRTVSWYFHFLFEKENYCPCSKILMNAFLLITATLRRTKPPPFRANMQHSSTH